MLQFDVVTLFPAMFDAVTELGVTGRARERGLYQFVAWNPRDFTTNVHRTVDDRRAADLIVLLARPLSPVVGRLGGALHSVREGWGR
jgi:tRNA (guanine37-N1)-methyltransferase